MYKIFRILTSRLVVTSVLIALQLLILALLMSFLKSYYYAFNILFILISIIVVVVIVNRNGNPNFKIAWIVPILMFPVFGGFFYLFFGRTHLSRKNQSKLEKSLDSAKDHFSVSVESYEKLKEDNPVICRQARYLALQAKSDIYCNTSTKFLSPGTVFFNELVRCLESAKKYIFLEYFIIAEGRMWRSILDILERKVKQGVEVRVIYDDIGAINTLPNGYDEYLRKKGIKVAVFNPYRPSIDVFMNYRDHRKIAIIDGKIGFTGGINIGDEYINEKIRYGYWQDVSIKIRGDAVNKLIIMFLQLWNFTVQEDPMYEKYLTDYKAKSDGYVIPFSDEPVTQKLNCQNAYLNIINNAQKYIYICTPYLILDDEMTSALIRAAHSGVRVNIITPYYPDKKIVQIMTRANYEDLIKGGIEIYEFTPGFMHAKAIVSDDEVAVVGTSNFDYRSFYLHFENNIWMYKSQAVMQAKLAHEAALRKSHEFTLEMIEQQPKLRKILASLIKVFAPLM
ncbi:MAG: cardiolipin synthase [Clostridiales bacterium]|nr:cardiolipin synthase [Clostridiales bacterium]